MTEEQATVRRSPFRNSSDLCLSLGSVLLGALALAYALSLPTLDDNRPGPGLFPGIVAMGFILFGLILAVQTTVRSMKVDAPTGAETGEAIGAGEVGTAPPTPVLDFERETISTKRAWVNGVAVIGGILLYILLADTLGFIISMFLLALMIMLILKARIVTSLVSAAVLTFGLWITFEKGLQVQLPNGLLW